MQKALFPDYPLKKKYILPFSISFEKRLFMSYPVPYSWVVSGVLLKDGAPFTQGKVQVFNRLADGTLDWMAENLEQEKSEQEEFYKPIKLDELYEKAMEGVKKGNLNS